jgi:tetratricopeptide (TPR) repeat protein
VFLLKRQLKNGVPAMRKPVHSAIAVVVVSALALSLCVFSPAYAGNEEQKRKEELQKKLETLKAQKRQLEVNAKTKIEKSATKAGGESQTETISRYERLNESCTGKKSERCADVMYTLAGLYYEEGRDSYVQARNDYEKAMDEYDRNPRGPEPVNPVPNYSKSLKMYQAAIAQYPSFEKADEGYYQIGTILMLQGDLDGSKGAFANIVSLFPNSIRASAAHFRMADFCFMDRDFTCALKHIEQIKKEEVNLEVAEMAHYRKAEIYYNRAELDRAAKLFFDYIDRCDAGEYQKKDLRNEALEYLAICFSDMPDGGQEAVAFFKTSGQRSFQDYVLYTVGMKNFNHGQFDNAVLSLQTALNSFPYYKDAPTAQQMLVACYVIKKKYEDANRERERLVDFYYKGGEWASRNAGNAAAIEQSSNEVKRALGQIAIYYHAEAQKKKKKDLYEKALKRYTEFFTKFPEDVWRNYEFKYNVAEIYNELKDYSKAAENYQYVAQQDISKFPSYKPEDDDTLGLDDEQKERLKKEKGTKKTPVSISQEDAGYNAIAAFDNLRKQKIAEQGLSDDQAMSMPETQKLLDQIHSFQKRFPKSNTAPEVLYMGGNILYAGKAYSQALVEFKAIMDAYPSSQYAPKSLRMLANSYASSGEYDMALSTYKQLLAKEKPGTQEYQEVVDLAGGALFKKADDLRKGGNQAGSAEAFKEIFDKFPASKTADRGWFEAGMCFEETNSIEMAAATFLALGDKFPKSDLREKAYVRAAEDFKKLNKMEDAAKAYELGAAKVAKPDYAIPSLSAAAESYQAAELFEKAGEMSEFIFQKYPTDQRTPLALYNAGLVYEKGKLYSRAISAYRLLAEKYPSSEYAAEGYYAIGFCHEKMGNNADMAAAFQSYAEKFPGDKSKQVMALVRSGEAYLNLNNLAAAEKSVNLAADIYEKFKGKAEIDLVAAARAYYILGEIQFKMFEAIKLKGANERAIEKQLKEKTKALEPVLKAYSKAIEIGVGEWTIRSTYRVGESFVEIANAYRDQSLFGSKDQQTASKIKIISGLEKYYLKAAEKFQWNVETAYEQKIDNEWVGKSKNKFMEMLYLNGHLFDEVGQIFKNAPIPKDLEPEEKQAYQDVLEEKYLEVLDKALPKYEAAIQAASELGIAESEWIPKIKERINEINPSSASLDIQLTERKPEQAASPSPSSGESQPSQIGSESNSNEKPEVSEDDQGGKNSGEEQSGDDRDSRKDRKKKRK